MSLFHHLVCLNFFSRFSNFMYFFCWVISLNCYQQLFSSCVCSNLLQLLIHISRYRWFHSIYSKIFPFFSAFSYSLGPYTITIVVIVPILIYSFRIFLFTAIQFVIYLRRYVLYLQLYKSVVE